MTTDSTAHAETSSPIAPSLATQVGTPDGTDVQRATGHGHIVRIAKTLAGAGYPRGALASLRRGGPDTVMHQPAFHRLTVPLDDAAFAHDGALRWATVIQGLALLTSAGTAPAREGAGEMLAHAGYSEQRLARLLASRGEALRDQVLLACRFLRGRGAVGVPTALFDLVLAGERSSSQERLRLSIARGYYRVVDRDSTVTSTGIEQN